MVPYDVRLRNVFSAAFVSEKAAESDLGRCNQDWLCGTAVGLALDILLWKYQSLQCIHRRGLSFADEHFTAIFEPLINRHRISLREILFSLVAVLGIVLIFHFDTRYRVGICMGVISSALASLFTIVNKKVAVNYTSSTMLLYEMLGGFLGLSCILPAYLHYFPVPSILPGAQDLIYLFCLASVCTVGLYILQIQVLKVISAFTVNLSYNLEPIYSIIGAMLIFQEAKDLNFSFYLGLGLIVLSVVLQTLNVLSQHHKFIPSLYVKWKR